MLLRVWRCPLESYFIESIPGYRASRPPLPFNLTLTAVTQRLSNRVPVGLRFIGEPEDVDRLLWSLPPAPSPAPTDDGPSFEFEFSDQSLPDVYKLPSDGGADDRKAAGVDDDDWVLFADVSTALSVKTAEALAKLLDDENAVTAVPADRFNERAVLRKSLGRQPVAVPATGAAANKSSAAERPSKDKDDDSVATKEAPSTTSSTSASTSISTSSTAAATTTTTTTSPVSSSSSTSGGEQILMVRYDRKLKQLLGVDVYTVS